MRKVLAEFVSFLDELDKRGLYKYAEELLDDLDSAKTKEQVDKILLDGETLKEILFDIDNISFQMLSVAEDSKTMKGIKSGWITGILYLEPGTSQIYNTDEFDKYVASQGKSKKPKSELWEEFKSMTTPERCAVICPEASYECLSECLVYSGNARFPAVIPARERRTSKLLHPATQQKAISEIRKDINKLVHLCNFLNSQYKETGIDFQPAVRINGTSDLPILKMFGNLIQEFSYVRWYDYTKVPAYMNQYLLSKSEKPGSVPENYHLTFSKSERNTDLAFNFLDRGGNVAMVFKPLDSKTPLPKFVEHKGKRYKVIDGDINDLRFLDDQYKTSAQGLIVGLKYKRTSSTRTKREEKTMQHPRFKKLEMLSDVQDTGFIIPINGEEILKID